MLVPQTATVKMGNYGLTTPDELEQETFMFHRGGSKNKPKALMMGARNISHPPISFNEKMQKVEKTPNRDNQKLIKNSSQVTRMLDLMKPLS